MALLWIKTLSKQNWELSKFNFWPKLNIRNIGYRQLLNPELTTAPLLYIFIKCLGEVFKLLLRYEIDIIRLLRYWSSKDSEAIFEEKFAKACKICMSESFDIYAHKIFDRYGQKFLSREETGNYFVSSSNFKILITFPDCSVAHKVNPIHLNSKSCFTCGESNLCWNIVNTTEILWLALHLNGRWLL